MPSFYSCVEIISVEEASVDQYVLTMYSIQGGLLLPTAKISEMKAYCSTPFCTRYSHGNLPWGQE